MQMCLNTFLNPIYLSALVSTAVMFLNTSFGMVSSSNQIGSQILPSNSLSNHGLLHEKQGSIYLLIACVGLIIFCTCPITSCAGLDEGMKAAATNPPVPQVVEPILESTKAPIDQQLDAMTWGSALFAASMLGSFFICGTGFGDIDPTVTICAITAAINVVGALFKVARADQVTAAKIAEKAVNDNIDPEATHKLETAQNALSYGSEHLDWYGMVTAPWRHVPTFDEALPYLTTFGGIVLVFVGLMLLSETTWCRVHINSNCQALLDQFLKTHYGSRFETALRRLVRFETVARDLNNCGNALPLPTVPFSIRHIFNFFSPARVVKSLSRYLIWQGEWGVLTTGVYSDFLMELRPADELKRQLLGLLTSGNLGGPFNQFRQLWYSNGGRITCDLRDREILASLEMLYRLVKMIQQALHLPDTVESTSFVIQHYILPVIEYINRGVTAQFLPGDSRAIHAAVVGGVNHVRDVVFLIFDQLVHRHINQLSVIRHVFNYIGEVVQKSPGLSRTLSLIVQVAVTLLTLACTAWFGG